MFYRADEPHGLPFDPFKAIIAPRPIGWIGTLNADGVPNLGPYSFFAALSSRPHMIGFSSEGLKHSPRNARDQGEFTFSLATLPLADAMNASSANLADGVNEFTAAGLELGQSRVIDAPFVKGSPAALECRTVNFMELTDIDGRPTGRYFVIGQVVGVHIRDEFIVDGRFDTAKAQPIARGGYQDYATVESVWEMTRPD
jgi:flavin reductase (DIM6/NTAB) family NADH-FMN oxidoreductase RutF